MVTRSLGRYHFEQARGSAAGEAGEHSLYSDSAVCIHHFSSGKSAQFFRFALVGCSGTVVNLVVICLVTKLLAGFHISEQSPMVEGFPLHFYHMVLTVGFIVSCMWNYQLNRSWTFQHKNTSWSAGFWKFFLTGIGAFLLTQLVVTLLMSPGSPLELPSSILDDSSGFRTKFYWASAIAIMVAMPVNFLLNKIWTFRGQPQ